MAEVEARLKALEDLGQRQTQENEFLRKQLEEAQRRVEELQKTEAEQQQKAAREEEARRRTFPLVHGPVDTRVMNKPENFSGKEEDWPKFSLLFKAFAGAMSPRMFELLTKAEDPEASLDRVDLDPGDEILDTQIYFTLTMLLRDCGMDKVELVEHGEGLRLWRLLVADYEPKWKSRKTSMHQQILNYQFVGDDIAAGFDAFEKLIRQYTTLTKKKIDDETKAGVVLSAMTKSSSKKQNELAEHLILNSDRFETYNQIRDQVKEVLGVKKHFGPGSSQDVAAIAKGKGKGGGKGNKGKKGKSDAVVSGELKIKFEGICHHCGKQGHKKDDCWHNPNRPAAKAKATPKGTAGGKGGGKQGCEYCGIKGHKKSECRKFKADQQARAAHTGASSSSMDDNASKKRRRDIAALEMQLAQLRLNELNAIDGGAGASGGTVVSALEIADLEQSPSPPSTSAPSPSLTSAPTSPSSPSAPEISAVDTVGEKVTIGIDSGAEITVWPPNLVPILTESSEESRRGTMYFGPGDVDRPSLANLGKRRYMLKIDGIERIMNTHVVPVRKPLLAVCDLLDKGHDVHFTKEASYAVHRVTGERINFVRRGGKFEMDVEVINAHSGNGVGQAHL